jgi:hypothetical protein
MQCNAVQSNAVQCGAVQGSAINAPQGMEFFADGTFQTTLNIHLLAGISKFFQKYGVQGISPTAFYNSQFIPQIPPNGEVLPKSGNTAVVLTFPKIRNRAFFAECASRIFRGAEFKTTQAKKYRNKKDRSVCFAFQPT